MIYKILLMFFRSRQIIPDLLSTQFITSTSQRRQVVLIIIITIIPIIMRVDNLRVEDRHVVYR